jgi:WASH complex subunit strumpellin
MIIGRLRSDDVYNQLRAYPFPEHRSVALATQASMLYVCLYFCPDILNNQASVMREVVDRFFPDNWVISIHMGMVINLQDAWEPYRAARTALTNTVDVVNVKQQVHHHEENLKKVLPDLQQLLKEGVLTEEMVLHKMSNILNRIRDSNVTLRWLMLHCPPPASKIDVYPSKKSHIVKDVLIKESTCSPLEVFRLLLLTSELEYKCKEIYQKLLHEKEAKWESFRKESHDRITELVDVFSGTKPLTRVAKNTGIQDQFSKIASELESLSFDPTGNPSVNSKKIVKLVSNLEELQDLHQLDSNLQVKQYVIEVRKLLHSMLRTMGIKEDVLITMQIVGDLTFAWKVIDNYTEYMQRGIKEDPSLVGRLRATFIKLSSALDLPLLRINQSESPNFISVSQYYSSELVGYVRKVLHIIPETLFSLMARIIDIQTNHIKELPTRLMKDQMKQYAQLEQRHEVARLTHSISLFAEGMLMMKTTLVGIIELDPKKLLEDGIRKELVLQVASALHTTLVFPVTKSKAPEVVQRLQALAQIMDGYKRSFEYVQDYIGIYGLKIWQEEVSRIVNFNIEQECNAFIRRKVLDFDSVYQSRNIPIPKFPPLDQFSVTFIGRLTRELLKITDPKQTVFVNQMRSWYDSKSRAEVVTPRLFTLMMQSIGTAGMNGVDRLVSFMIQTELQHVRKFIERNMMRDKVTFDQFESIAIQLDESDSEPTIPIARIYSPVIEKATKQWSTVNDALLRIGQMQLTKMSISHELHVSSRFQSRQLVSCLKTFNDAILNELSKKERIGHIPDDSPLLYELTSFLEWNGMTDPLSKVYLSDKTVTLLDIALLPIVISQASKFIYTPSIHSLTGKKPLDASDGTPYIIGLLTLLRQFKDDVSLKFVDRMSGYAKSLIESNADSSLPQEAVHILLLLQELSHWAKWPLTPSIPILSPQSGS